MYTLPTGARLFLTASLYMFNSASAQLLEAQYLDVRFPDDASCKLPYYDGNDSIYLFDGCMLARYNIHLFTMKSWI